MTETSFSSESTSSQELTLKNILENPFFKKLPDVFVSEDDAKAGLKEKYLVFNFEELNPERILKMYGIMSKLERLAYNAKEFLAMGKPNECYFLVRQLKFIGDEHASVFELGNKIGPLLEATHGNLVMTCAFLGLKNVENAPDWIEFIVRTWGETPSKLAKTE